MTIDDQHSFMKRRQDFESKYYDVIASDDDDILKTITTVDINTIDLCNRACVFCPRHDPSVYPNRDLQMTKEGATIIALKLREIKFQGTIAISGFGENLLNDEIVDIVDVLKVCNPKAFVELNTNGDPLTSDLAHKLIHVGLDCININMYDGPKQVDRFDEVLKFVDPQKRKYRAHWNPDDHGIIFNNRSGLIRWIETDDDMASLNKRACYYPFYKLFVDWNGDVLFCANDWGRTRVIGNLLQQSIKDLWMSKEMRKVRLKLAKSSRDFKPCDTCNVNGTLLGKQSFDIMMRHYEDSGYGK